nr:leucine-rich repeat domain-containing protein [Candidatus Sigynarchaeota archaeon]
MGKKKSTTKETSEAPEKSSKDPVKGSEAPAKGLTSAMYIEVSMKAIPKALDIFMPKWQAVPKTFKDEYEKKHISENIFVEILLGVVERELQPLSVPLKEWDEFEKAHGTEIDAFFASNPETKKKFDDLQKETNDKLEQFMNEELNKEISEAEKSTFVAIESKVKAQQEAVEESERKTGPLKFEVKDGHVVVLDLNSLNLKEVPTEVGSLIHLQELRVSYNNLESLPDSIANLTKLKDLSLSRNAFTKITFDFGKLEFLENLNLSLNQRLSAMPTGITSLKSLQRLYLSGDFPLPKTMSKLKTLILLDLNGEPPQLPLGSPQPVGYQSKLTTAESLAMIAPLTNLEKLTIIHSELETIPPYITAMKELNALTITFSRLKSIPTTIEGLKKLDSLNLIVNKLESVDPIANMLSLFSLFVSGNQLTTLPESFIKLKDLDYIDYSDNPIKDLPAPVTKWLDDIKERGGTVIKPW